MPYMVTFTINIPQMLAVWYVQGANSRLSSARKQKNCSHVVWANYHNSEMRTSDNP